MEVARITWHRPVSGRGRLLASSISHIGYFYNAHCGNARRPALSAIILLSGLAAPHQNTSSPCQLPLTHRRRPPRAFSPARKRFLRGVRLRQPRPLPPPLQRPPTPLCPFLVQGLRKTSTAYLPPTGTKVDVNGIFTANPDNRRSPDYFCGASVSFGAVTQTKRNRP